MNIHDGILSLNKILSQGGGGKVSESKTSEPNHESIITTHLSSPAEVEEATPNWRLGPE